MFGIGKRNLLPELMDQPGLAAADHHAALAGLSRVNTITRSANMLWPSIAGLATGDSPLQILDVASGGGDVTCALAACAAKANVAVEISGCDISRVAVEYAHEHASRRGYGNVDFFVHDILVDELPQSYDVIVSSLFLHHLDREQSLIFLKQIGGAATRGAFVSDLRRTRVGYAMAYVGTRLLSRSPIVHYDGPQSVAAAFRSSEALAIAREAGWKNATIRHQWPQRFLLGWEKGHAQHGEAQAA